MDASGTNSAGIAELERGRVYTIREVASTRRGYPGVRLTDPLLRNFFGDDGALRLSRFRPAVTRSQEHDVAKFKHLLNTTPASEDA